MISWGEFLQADSVNIHGIGVIGRRRTGGKGRERQAMSLFEGEDASFLSMEVDGFAHPGFERVWNFLHGVNHGGELGVQPIGK